MNFVNTWSRRGLYVIIFLAVLEVCARVDDQITYGVPILGTDRYTDMLTRDEFGIAGRPYGHYQNFQLNSLGFRGPEARWDRARIICIGASETFGIKGSPGMEYPRQLERELNARSTVQYSVVNTAIVGQSVASFARRVDKVVSQVKPEIAILYPTPASYIVPPSPQDDAWLDTQPPQFELRILDRIFAPVDRLPPWVKIPRLEFKLWKNTRHMAVMAKIPPSHVARFREDLSQVLDRLQFLGVRPILVTHATRFGAAISPEDRLWLLSWRTYSPRLAESGFLDMESRINDVIRAQAVARGIMLVDAANMLSGEHENFADFGHFTDRGAHALAAAIADAMCSSAEVHQIQRDATPDRAIPRMARSVSAAFQRDK